MAISTSSTYRAAGAGVAAAALLAGAFALGTRQGGPGTPAASAATLTAAQTGGRITVTGTGTVTGVPDQLVLSMGVQVTAPSVTSALDQANAGIRRVTRALRGRGVAQSDIQTSGLNISPDYDNQGNVSGYSVSESLTATLDHLRQAGSQINAAVVAGGNAVTIDGVSLNLTGTSPLMAAARVRAVADARTQARQYASALGEPLGPVISISAPQQSSPVVPEFGYANPTASGKAPVPVSPGTHQVSVSVTVVYSV
jgi:uncharacterized protein